jgi:hypothetical protein
VAFGSLGRSEFVCEYSDLDPLFVVGMKSGNQNRERIRERFLTPLIAQSPWLLLDDRDAVSAGKWESVKNADIKYPIYTLEQLRDRKEAVDKQRYCQLLLEAAPLYGYAMLKDITKELLPKFARPLIRTEPSFRIDFFTLTQYVMEFFLSFDNPQFLYKDAFKFWKTRFLREPYYFSNILNLLVGCNRVSNRQQVDPDYISGSTTVKLFRATELVGVLDRQLMGNKTLLSDCKKQVDDIIKHRKLTKARLRLYDGSYETDPARLFHGMLMIVLIRFAECWSMLYSEDLRNALMPKDVAYESKFISYVGSRGEDIKHLVAMRNSYLRYMAGADDVIQRILLKGGLLGTQVKGLSSSLDWLTQ